MAISAATVWETRASGASDNNGGGFVAGSGGTDRSQQNAAQVAIDHATITSSVTTSVITFTGGTYTVLAGDVGNIVQVISGTNTTPGFFQIVSVGAGLNGTWTMDRNVVSAGTQTDLVANMGGALATLGKLAGAMIASNKAFVTGAFTATATTTFAQTATASGSTAPTLVIGYGATRGDSVHATLTLQTNTGLTGINGTGNSFWVRQIDVDCGSLGTSIGIGNAGGNSAVENCKVSNFTSKGILCGGANSGLCYQCEVTAGTAAASFGIDMNGEVTQCFVHDNACAGIRLSLADSRAVSNLVVNNSGATSDGIQTTVVRTTIRQNTAHNNGRHGIFLNLATYGKSTIVNNLLTNNGGYGFMGNSGTAIPADQISDGNAFFSNTSGTRNSMDSTTGIFGVTPYTNIHDVTLSVSPYVGGTTGTTANFALNNTAGGGAGARAAGSPGTFPGNTGTTSYLDIGAVQTRGSNTSPSAGGSPGIIMATG